MAGKGALRGVRAPDRRGKKQAAMDPLVTVCLPTIGRTRYLELTIDSLAKQTRSDFEVLVLDNASPPDARARLEEWARREPRVRILRADPRVPMFANFNRGIRAARGRYVTFFHDDDVYHDDFLAVLVGALERWPSAAFAGSNYDFVDAGGAVTERRRWIPRTALWRGRDYIEYLLRRGRNPVGMPGLVFRRDVLGEGFDEGLSIHFGDFVLLMRYAERNDVAMIADACIGIRRHADQASLSMRPSEAIALRTKALEGYCAEYLGRFPAEATFARRMSREVRAARRTGVLWAWLSAADREDGDRSLAQLERTGVESALASALRLADRAGLTPERRRGAILRIARRVGTSLGI
jgi:glycosyltransferase involved in cell wall biosynthesis